MLKVAKFGGSSVADACQFKKVKDIIEAEKSRRYVVVSAPGKRHSEDNKITDLLYLCHAHIKYSVPYEQVFNIIAKRYQGIIEELGLDIDINYYLDEIKSNINDDVNIDYLVSRGEYLNAIIMAELLGYDFVDAKDIIFFNYNGQVDFEKTNNKIVEMLNKHKKAVIPGFYGILENGKIKTFSRGGSDITGSIISKAIGADIYENWTDVSGFLMADPRIVDNPKQINKITYRELRELSYMGATVLHDEAIFPVRDAGIPINIRNTNNPDNRGTIIIDGEDSDDSKNQVITGIAGKKNFTVIAIHKEHMANEVGFIKKVLEIFEEKNISIEHIPSGIDSVSIVISSEDIEQYLHDIVEQIKIKCNATSVKIYENMGLVATVGRNMVYKKGVAGKLFTALGENDVNIRMIDQGSSEINIIVGVENKDFEKAIKAIYGAFVK